MINKVVLAASCCVKAAGTGRLVGMQGGEYGTKYSQTLNENMI